MLFLDQELLILLHSASAEIILGTSITTYPHSHTFQILHYLTNEHSLVVI